MRSHDFTAVSYVVSGFVGQPRYMTAAQISEADRSGIEIGSHTVNHVNLARQSPNSMGYQLSASKQALEHLLGHPVASFCYPSGRFNSRVVSAVAAAGYHDATTTWFGSAHTLADRYTWGRVRGGGGEGLEQFAAVGDQENGVGTEASRNPAPDECPLRARAGTERVVPAWNAIGGMCIGTKDKRCDRPINRFAGAVGPRALARSSRSSSES